MRNKYKTSEDGTTVTIWLKRRTGEILACIVDAADFPKIQALNPSWHADWKPRARRFYARCNVPMNGKQKPILLHRFLMDAPQGLEVDHRNHNSLDNRRSNLRIGSKSENMMNRRGATCISKTGHRGIFPDYGGKFKLQITINGEQKHIGLFSTIEDAIAVRNQYPGYGTTEVK